MPEIELDIGAQLIASLETLSAAMARQERDRQRMAQAIRQVPLTAPQMTLSAGAGTIDSPDTLKAKTGYYWSVRRLTLQGWTAGTVNVRRNDPNGEVLVPFPVPAANTFGRGEILLNPDDRLVVTATGITGLVQLNGAADAFEMWLLPDYLI